MTAPKTIEGAKGRIAQTSEEVLNDECYRLYAHLIASITAFQLGKGGPPSDEEFALWRAAQEKRLRTTQDPIDTFLPRPDRREEQS
jgi:hypothetical protein